MRLLQYVGAEATFQISCHAIFGVFIIGFLVIECKSIKRQGRVYFKEYWNYHEWGVLLINILIALRQGDKTRIVTAFYEVWHYCSIKHTCIKTS